MPAGANVRDSALDKFQSDLIRFRQEAEQAHRNALAAAQHVADELRQRSSYWHSEVDRLQFLVSQGQAPPAMLVRAQQNLRMTESSINDVQRATVRYQAEGHRLLDLTQNVHPRAVSFLRTKASMVRVYGAVAAQPASTVKVSTGGLDIVGFSPPAHGGVVDLTGGPGGGLDLNKPVSLLGDPAQNAVRDAWMAQNFPGSTNPYAQQDQTSSPDDEPGGEHREQYERFYKDLIGDRMQSGAKQLAEVVLDESDAELFGGAVEAYGAFDTVEGIITATSAADAGIDFGFVLVGLVAL